MTLPYTPVCRLCRDNAPSYYITCEGCKVRRATAVKMPNVPLPAPSIPKPL